MYLVTSQEMKEMDRLTIESFQIPGVVLMESAGRGAVEVLFRHFPEIRQMKVGIVAGRGNNGGDGFVIARYLAANGVTVAVYLLSDKKRIGGDAGANLQLLYPMGVPVIETPNEQAFDAHRNDMRKHDIWIDAMLGTGLTSDVRGLFKEATELLNSTGKPVLAVDVPSGLDSDTGRVRGSCVRASVTATFGLPKIGQVLLPGAKFVGTLEVIDIGIPPHIVDSLGPKHRLMSAKTMNPVLRPRAPETHKGTTGHLLVLGGSAGKTGAAVMTSCAAMRVGAGLVTLGIPKSLNVAMESQLIEVMTEPLPETSGGALGLPSYESIMKLLAKKKGLAIGPGLGTAKSTQNLVRKLVRSSSVPTVIDADGLNSVVGHLDCLKKARVPVVMTPHPGEMARLVGTTPSVVQEDRIAMARDFASAYGVHVVLKGARTVVAHPDQTVLVNPTGNPGMASGGMGDVLAGIIAGLIVQGFSVNEAVDAGVYLHGSAADSLAHRRGPVGYLASDLTGILPEQLKGFAETVSQGASANPFVKSF